MAQEPDEEERGEDVRPLEGLPATFEELNVPDWLCACLRKGTESRGFGFYGPTPVQQTVIPLCRYSRHLVVQAKSGTGKTIAFASAAVSKSCSPPSWSVILAPTRELAMQHEEVVRRIAGWAPTQLEVVLCVGGKAERKAHHARENEAISRLLETQGGVLCATPGRLSAVLATRSYSPEVTRRIRCVVLDEADRLMDGNYDDHLSGFLSSVPTRAQVLCFSATYTDRLLSRIENITGRTNFVTPKGKASGAAEGSTGGGEPGGEFGAREGDGAHDIVSLKRVKQFFHECQVPNRGGGDVQGDGRAIRFECKADTLIDRVLASVSFDQAILFCRTKALCLSLQGRLARAGFGGCLVLFGEMPQTQRNQAMARMRKGKGRILVATDLVSRGIDLPQVDLVVNMDLPREGNTLMHRVGRAGRFGRVGTAVHLLCRSPGEDGGEELRRLFALLSEAGAHSVQPKPLFSDEAGGEPCTDLELRSASRGWPDPQAKQEFRRGEQEGEVVEVTTPSPSGEGGNIRVEAGATSSHRGSPQGRIRVDDLPEHVQRWLWWQWRHLWYCRLEQQRSGGVGRQDRK